MQKLVSLILGFSILLFSTMIHAQKTNFNCKIFEEIIQSILKQKEKLIVAKSLKDKVYITGDSTGMNPRIVNIGSQPNKYIDSLIKVSDYINIEDDSLFYLDYANVWIDTSSFFTKGCDCMIAKKLFFFSDDILLRQVKNPINVIEVKNIIIKDDYLIIILKSAKSRSYVGFYFKMESTHALLIKIETADPG